MFKKITSMFLSGVFIIFLSLNAQANESSLNKNIDELAEKTDFQLSKKNEGLELLSYNQNGVSAFAIIADHERYQLIPILAKNQISGRATVSQMNSSEAIATINASYFEPTGEIIGNTKIDDLTVSIFSLDRSTLGIKSNGATIFARQAYEAHLEFLNRIVEVTAINRDRSENSVVIYNRWYGATTRTNDFGLELIIQEDFIEDIIYGKGNNPIPTNGYVISIQGDAVDKFKTLFLRDKIVFKENFINLDNESEDFNEAIHIIGAGPTLVRNGEIYVTAKEEQFPADISVGRAPRSAVGITEQGDYILAVVDGRQAHSKGCTLIEWAEILKKEFRAVEAINLDGGGSSELIINGKIINKPSDGRERAVGSAISIIKR